MRAQRDCALLVVEGADDVAFWRSQVADGCELVDGEGKQNVIGCLHLLDVEGLSGVLAVVDADYDVLMGEETGSANILRTDGHDLECMMCKAPALDKVVGEYGDAGKVAQWDVRAALLERALVFGRFRWALLGLGPDDLGPLPSVGDYLEEVVDRATWAVDGDRLQQRVEERLGENAWRVNEAIDGQPVADPWHVVHGHDMVALLRVGLLRVLGEMRVQYGAADVARALRLAMSREDLAATTLGADIRRWEETNRYVVLDG